MHVALNLQKKKEKEKEKTIEKEESKRKKKKNYIHIYSIVSARITYLVETWLKSNKGVARSRCVRESRGQPLLAAGGGGGG